MELVPPGPVRYVGITFSPNSETLYYITGAPDGGRSILYRIPAMGGPTQKLKEGLNSPVTLSPNEEKFAFVREAAGESTLMIADLKSGSERDCFSRRCRKF
jgi:Tol biopolymer transport system component